MIPTSGPVSVYVALGSNLGDRVGHIRQACADIKRLPALSNFRCSSLYETDPMGPKDQPDYLNAVCTFLLEGISPYDLLGSLQAIEKAHGRAESAVPWTARPLDLDILLFGDAEINEPDLRIPHIGIAERSFVLWPLAELQSDLHIPGLGEVNRLKPGCQKFGIQPFTEDAK